MARLVCPNCGTDEHLYSIEKIEVMYPVTFDAESGEMDYAGTDSEYLDDLAQYNGHLFCRGCDTELQEHELVPEGGH